MIVRQKHHMVFDSNKNKIYLKILLITIIIWELIKIIVIFIKGHKILDQVKDLRVVVCYKS